MSELKNKWHFSRWVLPLLDAWQAPVPLPDWRKLGLVIFGGLVLTPLLYRLPMLGHDWYKVFYQGVLHMYPPWMIPLFAPFRMVDWRWGLAFVNSLTLVGVAAITAWQAENVRWDGLKAAMMALLNPTVWYLLWNGQVDGLVLISLLVLPWSIPLLLLRPQILGWVLIARKKWTYALVVWLGISVVIWGWWIGHLLEMSSGSIVHPTAMGWATLGWPIFVAGLVLLFFTEGHFWRILSAGFIAAPYLQPYHMVILYPALGRVTGWRRWALWGMLWVVGLAPGFVGWFRYAALGFPLLIWWFLRTDAQKGFLPCL